MGKIKLALVWLRRYGTWVLTGVLLAALGWVYLALRASKKREEALRIQAAIWKLQIEADAAYSTAVAEYTEADLKETVKEADELEATIRREAVKRQEERKQEDEDLKDATAEDLAEKFRSDGF